jgi:hypothetical protein
MTRRKDPKPDISSSSGTESAVAVTEAADPSAEIGLKGADPPVTEAESPEPTPLPPPARQSHTGLLGPLLGGALAALGGFALSHFNVFGLAPPDPSMEVAALTKAQEGLQSRHDLAAKEVASEMASIANRVTKLEATPAPPAPDLSALDDLERRMSAIEALPTEGVASTAAVAAKLADIEKRLATLTATGTAADLQAELDAALNRLDEAEAAAAARATEAQATAVAARRAQALDALGDAVEAGAPFAAELTAFGDPVLSASLGPFAESGVPNLAKLQAGFPDPARKALAIAREASTEDGWGGRLVDFLAAQTEARSLTPQEGDDPGAILSRAEFALSQGKVAEALAELAVLDPAVSVPLESWMADANSHLAAMTALNAARGN